MWPYWLLTAVMVLLIVSLGIVTGQRDKARTDADLYRHALIRVDPQEARAMAFISAEGRWKRDRSPLRCRLGLHRWRRRPSLAVGWTQLDASDLTWPVKCSRCDADRDKYRGVAP